MGGNLPRRIEELWTGCFSLLISGFGMCVPEFEQWRSCLCLLPAFIKSYTIPRPCWAAGVLLSKHCQITVWHFVFKGLFGTFCTFTTFSGGNLWWKFVLCELGTEHQVGLMDRVQPCPLWARLLAKITPSFELVRTPTDSDWSYHVNDVACYVLKVSYFWPIKPMCQGTVGGIPILRVNHIVAVKFWTFGL